MLISDLKHGLFKYEVKDYYAILGVPIFSNPKEIRLRYLKLAYQLHPDTNRAETKEDNDRASSILSKVVNRAYENLYKDKLRKETELIFKQISRRLTSEIDDISVSSEIAKKLLQEDKDKIEQLYKDTIETISKEQYQDLDKVQFKICLLSELNMIYLVRQKEESTAKTKPVEIASTEGGINQPTVVGVPTEVESVATEVQDTTAKEPVSRLDKLINSATKHMQTGNLEPAVLELREAVKLDSTSAIAHALLGSLYLDQDNKTYGRIHINKAMKLDPQEPKVKQAQQKLKAIEKSEKKASSQGKSGKSKGKKEKKEAPTIFGIRLW